MPAYDCPRDGCEYCTPNVPDAAAAVQDQLKTAHPVIPVYIKKAKPPSIALPKVTKDIMDMGQLHQ